MVAIRSTHEVTTDPHGHALAQAGHHSAHGPEGERIQPQTKEKEADSSDIEAHEQHARAREFYTTTMAQIIGVSILEFGVIFHSVLIGLTLAVDEDFKVLFIVLVFHREFGSFLFVHRGWGLTTFRRDV